MRFVILMILRITSTKYNFEIAIRVEEKIRRKKSRKLKKKFKKENS